MEKEGMKKILAVVTSALLISGTQVWAADTDATTTSQPSLAVVNVPQLFQ
jgi:hypothetical protein